MERRRRWRVQTDNIVTPFVNTDPPVRLHLFFRCFCTSIFERSCEETFRFRWTQHVKMRVRPVFTIRLNSTGICVTSSGYTQKSLVKEREVRKYMCPYAAMERGNGSAKRRGSSSICASWRHFSTTLTSLRVRVIVGSTYMVCTQAVGLCPCEVEFHRPSQYMEVVLQQGSTGELRGNGGSVVGRLTVHFPSSWCRQVGPNGLVERESESRPHGGPLALAGALCQRMSGEIQQWVQREGCGPSFLVQWSEGLTVAPDIKCLFS